MRSVLFLFAHFNRKKNMAQSSKNSISFSVSAEDAQRANSSLSQKNFFLGSDNEDSDAGSSSDKLWTEFKTVNARSPGIRTRPANQPRQATGTRTQAREGNNPQPREVNNQQRNYDVFEGNMNLFLSAMGKPSSDTDKETRIRTVYISYLQGALFRIKMRLYRIVRSMPLDPLWIFGVECPDLMYCIARYANTEYAVSKLMKTGTYMNRNIFDSQRIVAIRQLDTVCAYDYVIREIKRAIGKFTRTQQPPPVIVSLSGNNADDSDGEREEFTMSGKKPRFNI
jgi:hypothetical protein